MIAIHMALLARDEHRSQKGLGLIMQHPATATGILAGVFKKRTIRSQGEAYSLYDNED